MGNTLATGELYIMLQEENNLAGEHDHNNGGGHPVAAAAMREACQKLVDSLSSDQKAKTIFHELDGERIFWYYPPLNRHGLPLRDMDQNQRKLAFALLESGLTPTAYERTVQIIEHEAVLGPLEKENGIVSFVRDPDLYYWTVFGDPGSDNPWGWRVEGHHVSLHYHMWGDRVISTTPFFFGANPAEVRSGPKTGLRILGNREDMALELINSLDSGQRSTAIVNDAAPYDILTYNASKALVPKEEGLLVSKMNGGQQEMVMSLISEYVGQVREDLAQEKMDRIKENGIGDFTFTWAGAVEKDIPHYYRIHGGNFLVEYDNKQNGANHIHSVLRDVENDFGIDVLREHLLLFHVI